MSPSEEEDEVTKAETVDLVPPQFNSRNMPLYAWPLLTLSVSCGPFPHFWNAFAVLDTGRA